MARTSYTFEKFQREKRKAAKKKERMEKKEARRGSDDGEPSASADAESDENAVEGPAVPPT